MRTRSRIFVQNLQIDADSNFLDPPTSARAAAAATTASELATCTDYGCSVTGRTESSQVRNGFGIRLAIVKYYNSLFDLREAIGTLLPAGCREAPNCRY